MKNMAVNEMKFYQILIAIAFSVNTGHPYYYIFRYIIYLGIFNYILSLIIAPLYIICEGQNMSMIMELILYMMCGILHSMHLIVIALNKQSIVTTYNFIQTNFINWSVKKGMDPNGAYKMNKKIIKYFVTIWSFLGCTIMFSPLLSTIADLGKFPLDHQSHWNTHWPMLFSVNNLYTYGLIYLLQTILAMFLITATGAMKCGFIIFLSELNYQFEHLLYGLENAFNHRMEQQFKIVFFDCIRHHQLIIKYVNNFKSYFKWITLINIFMLQGIISTSLYCIIKHNRLAERVYNMTWYDMPNQHKKLLVIMFQRTQKDLIPNAAIFSSQVLSRSLITKFVKQIYTLLNVLLKT